MPATDTFPSSVKRLAPVRGPRFPSARLAQIVLTFAGTGLMVGLFAASVVTWTPLAVFALVLVCVSAAWISGGAATALIGALWPLPRLVEPPAGWVPARQSVVLMTLCGEDSASAAAYLASLHTGLSRARMGTNTRIVVLSDTGDAALIDQEEADLKPLIRKGTISYRRRLINHGRKPGNIADWVRRSSAGISHMLVLDADSRMSVSRIRAMIWQMEQHPKLGLLQAGIALLPGRSRFGRHQRLSARLLSPNFLRGFTAWTGSSGNYWGHNALIRLSAFRSAMDLPVLKGRAPFGGEILSHDFVEAAWIRRAGWAVEVEPGFSGSAEDAPQTLQAFSRRDRRWCQGNLQHIGVLGVPGLHPVSRVHLMLGIISYLAAPIWLSLLFLLTSGAVSLEGAAPLLPVAVLLLMPKLCSLPQRLANARTTHRRKLVRRAFVSELVASAVLAPIIMVRQTGAVIAVLLGQDCGWKRQSTRRIDGVHGVLGRVAWSIPVGVPEAAVSLVLCALAILTGTGLALWLMPVILPLLLAPLIVPFMDAPA